MSNPPMTAVARTNGEATTVPALPADALQFRSLEDLERLGKILAASGFFKDARDAAQCITKILYGREVGLAPVQSMMGVHIIEGKPAPSAALVAALIKRSGRYTYRVSAWSDKGCELEFFERGPTGGWDSLGVSSFVEEDAKRAGLLNRGPWKSFPKSMYFARAVTLGARTFTPDVFGGPVFDPDEFQTPVESEDERWVAQQTPAEPIAGQARRRPANFPGESLYSGDVVEAAPLETAPADQPTPEATPLDLAEREAALDAAKAAMKAAGVTAFGLAHILAVGQASALEDLDTATLNGLVKSLDVEGAAAHANREGYVAGAVKAIKATTDADELQDVAVKWIRGARERFVDDELSGVLDRIDAAVAEVEEAPADETPA